MCLIKSKHCCLKCFYKGDLDGLIASDYHGWLLGFYKRLDTDSSEMSFIFAGLARRDIEVSTGSEIMLDLKEKYNFKVGKEKREIFFA